MCAPWDTGCVADEVAAAATSSILGQLAHMLVTAELYMINASASWWVLVPSIKLYPDAGNTNPDATPIAAVANLRALILPLAVLVAVGGMLWNGLLMVLSRKPAPLVNVLRGLWNTALWSAVGIFGTSQLLHGTDQFSAAVIGSALGRDATFGQRMAAMLVPDASPAAPVPVGVTIIVAGIALVCACIQAVLMLFRDGAVLILAAMMPLAASGSFTHATSGWLRKVLAWQLSLIFYKPVAALVYAVAIWLQGDRTATDPRVMFMGVAMILISLVALPVLLRFFNWTVGSLQSGGGGLGLLATAGAAGLHGAAALRGVGGGFAAGDHARYLSDSLDRGTPPGGALSGTGSGPTPSPIPGSGSASSASSAGSASAGRPPVFVGSATGTASSTVPAAAAGGGAASVAGAGAGSTAAAGTGTAAVVGASAATGPAAPIVAGAAVITGAAVSAAKSAATAAGNAASDATNT